MTQRTSLSDAQRLDAAFDQAISAARSDKSLGAGQRATAVHGLEIERDNWRWGEPLFPAEPISQVIAALQRDYLFYSWCIEHWQPENHPLADRRIDALGEERSIILDQLVELTPREIPGIYTEARTMEDLERLLAPPIMPSRQIDYQALKDRIDITDYIGRYVQLRRSGPTRMVGRCPFHDEKTASFVVYQNTRSFYCFGCMAGGDVIDFAKRAHGSLPVVT